jgi:hypothetical protein
MARLLSMSPNTAARDLARSRFSHRNGHFAPDTRTKPFFGRHSGDNGDVEDVVLSCHCLRTPTALCVPVPL